MELPNYRMVSAKNVGRLLWDKARDFLERAFSVIFIATIVIWFLQTFDPQFNIVDDSSTSMMAIVGGWLAPILSPLGLGDWRVATALISGFLAKESVVSTLSILYGTMDSITAVMSVQGAASMLVFCLLYTPCVAAIAAIRRELGDKWAVCVVIQQCAIAWIAAFAVRLLFEVL